MIISNRLIKLALLLSASLLLNVENFARAFETLGAIFEFDASQDVGGDATWTETGLFGNETLTFVGGATPTATQVSDGSLNLFAHSVGADGVSNAYEATLGGAAQASRRNATFEIWFKPNDLTTANQIIHETGGSGRGTIISLDNNSLEFLANGDNSIALSTTLANNNWTQVVGVLNNISNDGSSDDFLQLYVNGALVDTSASINIDDWAGGNQGGLGSFGGASHPIDSQIGTGTENNLGADFNGNIHLNRYYDRALSGAEIAANFDAVANPGSSWAVDADGTWNNSANWSGGIVPGSGGDAILGPAISAPRTLTLNVNTNLGGLALNDTDGYAIAAGGGTLTFSGSAELRVNSGAHEIAAPIAGTVGIVKTAGGTVSLSGTNTFSGGIQISGGTLAVSSDANLGNAGNDVTFNSGALRIDGTTFNTLGRAITLSGNGTLNVADAGNTVNVTGAVTGPGNLVKAGDGAAELSNAATYDGNISVNGGALVVASNNGLGTTNGTTQVGDSGGTVELDGSGGSLTIAENFNNLIARFDGVPEAHIRNTAGNNSLIGTIQAGGGDFGSARFENAAAGTTLTINNTVSHAVDDRNFNFVFQGTGDFQVGNSSTPNSGKIVGNNVSVIVELDDPTDTVTISTAQNTTDTATDTGSYWGGNTTIRSGTLAVEQDGIQNNGELPGRSINVQAGGTFDVSDFSAYSLQIVDDPDGTPFNGDEIGQILSGSGTINTGSGTITAFEDSVITPGDSAGTLNVSGNMTINQAGANPNGALNYELSDVTTVGGGVNDLLAVSGNLNLLANGAAGGGQFKLNITPINGDLAAGNYTIMTRGGTTATTATSADFDIALFNADGVALNSRQDDSSTVTINANSVTVSFSAAESHNWTGNLDGTWDVGSTANWSSTDGRFFDLDTVNFGDGTGQTSVNIVGPLTPGGVNFTNTVDTYTFTGNGIQGSGALNLAANTNAVLANSGNTFSGGTNIAGGATLTLGDGTSNVGSLAGGSNVANSGTLAFNRTGYGFFTQVVSGTGNVEVNGGFVDLAGANTYSGGSTINGGTLRIRNPSAAGTGAVVVNNGGAFETGYFANQIFSKSVTLNDGSTLSVTDPDDSGAAPVNTGQITWSNPIVLGGTGGIVSTTAGDGVVPGMTVAGGITGSGDLTLGADTDRLLIVNSPLTHSGNTSIAGGGTVALQGSTSISSPLVQLQSNSTLDVAATTSGTLALSGQMLTGVGAVTGNVTTSSNATIRVGGIAAGTPSVVTGLQLNYDAAQDAAGNGTWDDSEATAGNINLNFTSGAATPVAVNDATFAALTAAYDISTSGGALVPASDNAYFDQRGTSSGTFELVFNVTDTNAGDEQVLMDIGGGRGVAVTLDGSTLTAGVNGDAVDTTSFNTTLATGWHHAVVVIEDTDPADGSDDVFTLYVDNAVVGTLNTVDIDDYAGSNGWSFGALNSVALDPTQLAAGAPTLAAPIDFHGEIAIARYYQAALTAGDVNTNFQALQGDPFVGVDTISIDGDLTLDGSSTIELDIFDITLGSDLLDITGAFMADGTLDISLAGSVNLGETYDIFNFDSASGSFDSINLPSLGGGLGWDTSQLLVSGILEVIEAVDVDLDNDGDVDGRDFLLIQRTDPSLIGAWQTQYGSGAGPLAAGVAVPEPSAIMLTSLGVLTICVRKSRCRNST
ncbi:MAG: LamG-like jellyroll fold domain-containing protein [Planctomycetota bacterium]